MLSSPSTFLISTFILTFAVLIGLRNIQFVFAKSLTYENSDQHAARMSNNLPGALGGSHNHKCMQGWMWFNNKCWVATASRRDMVHAQELCKKMFFDSTLPTIHSEEENEFLRNNIDLRNSPIWLYANHNHQYGKTSWLDKSPVNYTRWDSGQPSEKSSMVCIKTEDSWYMKKTDPVNGNTECVSFWEDAKWSTSVGCSVLLPVVCEKKLTSSSRYIDANNSSPMFGEVTSALAGGSIATAEVNKLLIGSMAGLVTYYSHMINRSRLALLSTMGNSL